MPAAELPLHWSSKPPRKSRAYRYATGLLRPYGLRRRACCSNLKMSPGSLGDIFTGPLRGDLIIGLRQPAPPGLVGFRPDAALHWRCGFIVSVVRIPC